VPNDPSTDWYASRVEERPAWLTRAVGLGRAEVWGPAGEGVRANCILAREIWEAEGSVWGGRWGGPEAGACTKQGGKLGEAKAKVKSRAEQMACKVEWFSAVKYKVES
jgi:hypothetical protein